MFQSSWTRCWRSLCTSGDGEILRQELLAAYGEPQRKYHTLQHLGECLSHFEKNLHLAERQDEVEIALWFHDAVYDVMGNDNEAKSAAWAVEALGAAGVSTDAIGRIKKLILASCHSVPPESQDEQLLMDVDISILGAARPRFIEYESQVRAEYLWMPELLFRQKRGEILQKFLVSDHIYGTPSIRRDLEPLARENLAYSLGRLINQPFASLVSQ